MYLNATVVANADGPDKAIASRDPASPPPKMSITVGRFVGNDDGGRVEGAVSGV